MMTPEQITSMITAVGTVITAIGIVLNNLLAKRNARLSAERNAQTMAKIKEVHDATNGMKTELVNEVREAASAKGVLTGMAVSADSKSEAAAAASKLDVAIKLEEKSASTPTPATTTSTPAPTNPT